MQRIVLYSIGRLAEDAEILQAIAAATGHDERSVAALLAGPGPVYLDHLEDGAAAELFELLRARGVDADLEPMSAPQRMLEWLSTEAPKWVKRGLVHPDSLPRILASYGLEAPHPLGTPAAASPGRQLGSGALLRAVLTLGAVLIGLGLILFIAANWQRIPSPAKIGGALALTVVALHLGYRFRYGARPHPRLAATLWLLALFGIGGVVLLIGQIYHVQAESYLLPLIWGALCVPLTLLLRFAPALYLTNALWLWAYWLYFQEAGELPWIYPLLLLGFLLPYALAVGDKRLHVTHLVALMLAAATTGPAGAFWQSCLFAAALIILRFKLRQGLYDWLLVAAFLFWHLTFLVRFEELPNVLYALPLAYFVYRALETGSNALMSVTAANVLLWLSTLLVRVTAWFDLDRVVGTGFLLWLFAAALLLLGLGRWLRGLERWRLFTLVLRSGGAALAGLTVYVLSFRFYEQEASLYGSPVFLGAALAAGGAGIALALLPGVGRPESGGRRALAVVLALAGASLVLSVAVPPALLVHPLMFNLILFAAALAMMMRGYETQSLAWYNGGIGLFVVLIVSRYLDTLVEFLPRSVFFVAGGLFLIGWAVFVDRQRKRRAARAQGGADDV